jgi:hypothetical protein
MISRCKINSSIINLCSLGNKQGAQALFPAIKEVISFYEALEEKELT